MTIHFGTDGWRAVISDTFTFENLRLVAQAIADAVNSESWTNGTVFETLPDPKTMVVGFDTRFLSDRYAAEVARVLAANGYTVYLTQADAPTPVVSYAVKYLHAIGGVMITASHNAPRYNGVKLKSALGNSALPEQCRRVEVYLNDNEQQARGPNLMDFEIAREKNLIRKFNPIPAYYEHLRTLIDFDLLAIGIIGAILILALVLLLLVAPGIISQQRANQAEQAAQINAENTATAMAATALALQNAATSTPVPNTPAPTSTPVIAFATSTPVVAGAQLSADELATVSALQTQMAAQGGSGTTTPQPTSTALPTTGFADNNGIPMIIGLATLLIIVILLSRKLRTAAR